MMKTNVRETSMETHHSDAVNKRDLTVSFLIWAKEQRRFTNRMAAEHFGCAPGSMSGIIKPLKDEGTILEEIEKKPCRITGNNALWLYHRDWSPQGRLFN